MGRTFLARTKFWRQIFTSHDCAYGPLFFTTTRSHATLIDKELCHPWSACAIKGLKRTRSFAADELCCACIHACCRMHLLQSRLVLTTLGMGSAGDLHTVCICLHSMLHSICKSLHRRLLRDHRLSEGDCGVVSGSAPRHRPTLEWIPTVRMSLRWSTPPSDRSALPFSGSRSAWSR